jgi:thymidylate synthase
MPTLEVLGAVLALTDPTRRLVDVPPVRVLNPAFAAAETVWILSGSDEDWIFQYNEKLAQYVDDGKLMGAYGPRLRRWHGVLDQLDRVRTVLSRDPASRQAVIQLFDPVADSHDYKDVPCTLGYRFFLRDGALHMHTTMRSQDLWVGFCYDVFTATMLQELLAGWLGASLGTYRHFTDSLHLYSAHLPAAKRLPAAATPGSALLPVAAPWPDFDKLLGTVIVGGSTGIEAWDEIAAVLTSYRAWKTGDRAAAHDQLGMSAGPLAGALTRWYARLEHAQ